MWASRSLMPVDSIDRPRKAHHTDTPSPTPTKQPKRRVFVGQKVGSESFWLVAL